MICIRSHALEVPQRLKAARFQRCLRMLQLVGKVVQFLRCSRCMQSQLDQHFSETQLQSCVGCVGSTQHITRPSSPQHPPPSPFFPMTFSHNPFWVALGDARHHVERCVLLMRQWVSHGNGIQDVSMHEFLNALQCSCKMNLLVTKLAYGSNAQASAWYQRAQPAHSA